MRKAKIFIINGIILTFSSLLIRGAGLIFNIYVANKVGQEAIGIFSLVMSVYSFAITFATSGVSLACTCIVSEEFAKNNFSKGITAVKTCIFFALILGLSASFLLFLLAPIISSNWLNGNVSNIPIYSISLGLPLISISAVIGGFLTSIGKSYKSAFAQCIELAIKIFATYFLLSFSITKGIDAICTSLIIGDVISELFSFLLNFIFYIIEKRKFKLSRSYNKELNIKIAVITDNDEKDTNLSYMKEHNSQSISQKIFMDNDLKNFTWEVALYNCNEQNPDLEKCAGKIDPTADYKFNKVIYGKNGENKPILGKMLNNKVDVAYKILQYEADLQVPKYVKEAFKWINE